MQKYNKKKQKSSRAAARQQLAMMMMMGLLLLVAIVATTNGANAQMEQMNQMGSIATGSGRIFRPTRSTGEEEDDQQQQQQQQEEMNDNNAAVEDIIIGEQQQQQMKRSMSLGRLAFRPGKRRFLPISGAFARDPLNRRYELLFMDGGAQMEQQQYQQQGAEATNVVPKNELQQQQFTQLVNPMRFRMLPSMVNNANEVLTMPENNEIVEAAMGKRSSLASGRIGFRPAKRSMAVGRTGFRPGKRSIATGRVRFRPGKRAAAFPAATTTDGQVVTYLWL